MNYLKKKLSFLLILLLLFTLALGTSPFAGANTLRTATVNVSVLNVRSGPGLQHTVITQVTLGTVLPVLSEQLGWVQVSLGSGKSGWVTTSYVTVKNEVASAPAQSVKVNVSVLNVRSGPGTQHSRLTTVSLATILTVLQKQGAWLQVRLPSGQTGWVAAEYTTPVAAPAPPPSTPQPPVSTTPATPATLQPGTVAVVNVSVLNVRSGPDTAFQLLTTVSRDTALTILQAQGEWLQVKLPSGQTGWVSAQYTDIPAASPPQQPPSGGTPSIPDIIAAGTTAVLNVNSFNVRSSPNDESEIMSTIYRNSVLPVISKQGEWLQVELPSGQAGWVTATYTTLVPPAQQPSPSVPSPDIQKMAVVTVSALNARSAPSTDAPIITLLPQATTLPIISEQGDWLQVSLLSGQTAWVAGWHVTVFTQQAPAPGGSGSIPIPSGPSPLTGKIIVIDPGHGGGNSGAIGITGLPEKAVVLDVSLRVAAKLRQAGAIVIMTRDDDSTVHLAERVAIAEATGAHAFVSIHANAHPDRNVSGTETYYFRNKPNFMESYYLAAHLQNELVKALGLRDIGVKHGNFHVIRETTMPSALVELAFLSNANDEALLKTDDFRERSAHAIFLGLQRFFQF